ncbi:MAG: hypothetical protein ACRETW_01480 [Stenotrophobium sp.]
MNRNAGDRQHDELAQVAARIYCVERLTDYRLAKQKAAQRLNLGPRAALPDNAAVQRAVIGYQQLFGGAGYRERLRLLRETAARAMKLLAEFLPRLAGGAVSGAVHAAHRVQLHAFCDAPETLEIFLRNHGIACTQDDRSYRYAGGAEQQRPLLRFEASDIGVDVAIFPADELRRPPLDPADGQPFARLGAQAVEVLLREN